jgi:hypothetical protein
MSKWASFVMLTKRMLLSEPSFGSLSCHTGMASIRKNELIGGPEVKESF